MPPANLQCPSRALRSRGNVLVVDRQGELLANLSGSLRKHVRRLCGPQRDGARTRSRGRLRYGVWAWRHRLSPAAVVKNRHFVTE